MLAIINVTVIGQNLHPIQLLTRKLRDATACVALVYL